MLGLVVLPWPQRRGKIEKRKKRLQGFSVAGLLNTSWVRCSFQSFQLIYADICTGIAVNLLLLLSLTHLSFPRARRRTRTFFELSYYDSTTGRYTQGWDDLYFVMFWITVFIGLRVAIMDYVLMPLARASGIQKKKARVRFAEQAWLLLYSSIFWSLGMVSP